MSNEICSYGDKCYIAYVFGYDLLHGEIDQSRNPECDTSFEICLSLAEEFFKSEEMHDYSMSMYEALEKWIYNNYEHIVKKLNGEK